MQIHELNNFTGTLGSGSFLAVDNGTDTGKLSTQQLLAATEARIDNIIAGPAPSAEEIVDARLGDDGVVYPSLGDAIRDQFSDVKSEISEIDISSYEESVFSDKAMYNLQKGMSYSTVVNNRLSGMGSSTTGYKIPVTNYNMISFPTMKTSGTSCNYAVFDSNDTLIEFYVNTILDTGDCVTFGLPENASYVVIVIFNDYFQSKSVRLWYENISSKIANLELELNALENAEEYETVTTIKALMLEADSSGYYYKYSCGQNASSRASQANANFKTKRIPVSAGDECTFPAYQSSMGYGSAFVDSSDKVLDYITNSGTNGEIFTVTAPASSAYLLYTSYSSFEDDEHHLTIKHNQFDRMDREELDGIKSALSEALYTQISVLSPADFEQDKVEAGIRNNLNATAIGSAYSSATKFNDASSSTYCADVSAYKKINLPIFKSSDGSGGILFVDEDGVIIRKYSENVSVNGTRKYISVPTNTKYCYFPAYYDFYNLYIYGLYSTADEEFGGGGGGGDNPYPTLTSTQKAQLKSLCDDYYAIRSNFTYGGNTRDNFMTTGSSLLCGTFAQMIYMGRSASDFIGTYANVITKAFDWGYYFDFPIAKRCYGVVKPDNSRYGFSFMANANYSFNSFSGSNRTFMMAADMAAELYNMGCEIPRSEVQVGDLLFYCDSANNNMSLETQLNFRHISHVAIVYDIDAEGFVTTIECTLYSPPIVKTGLKLDDTEARVRAGFYENAIVMCARHPAAYGKGGNVPNAFSPTLGILT